MIFIMTISTTEWDNKQWRNQLDMYDGQQQGLIMDSLLSGVYRTTHQSCQHFLISIQTPPGISGGWEIGIRRQCSEIIEQWKGQHDNKNKGDQRRWLLA
jgi:hypothetical protein